MEGIDNDFFNVYRFIDEYLKAASDRETNHWLLEALSMAAIITYARPFSSGIRESLGHNSNPNLSAEEQFQHEAFIAIRSKHVAHPVNQCQTHSIYVWFTPDDPKSAKVTNVSTGSLGYSCLSTEQITTLRALCAKWSVHVKGLMEAERIKLMPHALALSSQELVSLARGPVDVDPDPKKHRVKK